MLLIQWTIIPRAHILVIRWGKDSVACNGIASSNDLWAINPVTCNGLGSSGDHFNDQSCYHQRNVSKNAGLFLVVQPSIARLTLDSLATSSWRNSDAARMALVDHRSGIICCLGTWRLEKASWSILRNSSFSTKENGRLAETRIRNNISRSRSDVMGPGSPRRFHPAHACSPCNAFSAYRRI